MIITNSSNSLWLKNGRKGVYKRNWLLKEHTFIPQEEPLLPAGIHSLDRVVILTRKMSQDPYVRIVVLPILWRDHHASMVAR